MRAPRTRRPANARVSTILLFLGAGVAFLAGCDSGDPPPPPPIEIDVVEVVQRDQPITMEMVGETRGSSDIPIRARVEGVLLSMDFIEGRAVEKDQLLYTIDPEPFESEVIEAQGSMAEVETGLVKAKADLDRIRPLAEMNAVSQSDLDSAVAQYDAAGASLKSARERVVQAQIRLGYTRILAPISGRVGISAARVGEFVGMAPNPVVLNYVSNTHPIRVRFSVDERTYLTLARRVSEFRQAAGEQEAPTQMGQTLELTLADGSIHPYPGRLVAADAAVDPKTGTFTMEADFPNPASEAVVVAGQFARVRAVAEVRKDALLVPSRATSELQGSFRVYVVAADGSVELRPVELGPKVDNFQIVDSGIEFGERVAIEIMRLQPGMTVKPKVVPVDDKGIPKVTEEAPKSTTQGAGKPEDAKAS